jgi:hypothetical protein
MMKKNVAIIMVFAILFTLAAAWPESDEDEDMDALMDQPMFSLRDILGPMPELETRKKHHHRHHGRKHKHHKKPAKPAAEGAEGAKAEGAKAEAEAEPAAAAPKRYY